MKLWIDDINPRSTTVPTVPTVPTGWRRGDPEPPQGINVLRDPVAEGEAFLCRLEDGTWEWFSDPDDRTGVRVSQPWDQAMQEADGPVYPVPAVSEQTVPDVK